MDGIDEHHSAAGLRLPDIVLFCDPSKWPAADPAAQQFEVCAVRAAAAVAAVRPFDLPGRRDTALVRAQAEMSKLGAAIDGVVSPVAGEDIDALSAVQAYFRIRAAPLDRVQCAAQVARVAALTLEDLRWAPLAGSDLERICTGLRLTIIDVLELRDQSDGGLSGGPLDGDDEIAGAAASGDDLHTLWFRRWILGHHLHALFNVMGTVALRSAVAALSVGDAAAAAACIARATTYVEAYPAARAYTLALPASFYNSALRPSMMPPLVEVPLSGKMHVEYQRYRQQLESLLAALPAGIRELARVQPSLALAREALLEADLLDSQRHSSLVEPHVGTQKSLVQNVRTKENAVSMLRAIHNRRAARFAKYLRYPESPGESMAGHASRRPDEGTESAVAPSRALSSATDAVRQVGEIQ